MFLNFTRHSFHKNFALFPFSTRIRLIISFTSCHKNMEVTLVIKWNVSPSEFHHCWILFTLFATFLVESTFALTSVDFHTATGYSYITNEYLESNIWRIPRLRSLIDIPIHLAVSELFISLNKSDRKILGKFGTEKNKI